MGVDASAMLVYGWQVSPNEKTGRFRELNEEDFTSLDGKYEKALGCYYTSELVICDDDYSDDPYYHIGVQIEDRQRVYEGDRLVRFEEINPGEFADACLSKLALESELRKLYWDVMGEVPKTEPYVDLYVRWW